MENSSPIAPIASPHGGGEGSDAPSKCWDGTSPRISVRLSLASAFRRACVELFQPSNVLTNAAFAVFIALVLAPQLGISLYFFWDELWVLGLCFVSLGSIILSLWQHLFLSSTTDVELRPDGVRKRAGGVAMVLPWRKFLWIGERGGDIWMVTFASACFVPCEAFASREQSHEFARLVRELRRTNGAAWETILTRPL